MKETVQLQFGAFSNAVGAEMINMEYYRSISGDDQVDHNSFLRPIDSDPESGIEPRVVAYDFDHNFYPGVLSSATKYDWHQLYRDMSEPWGGITADPCRLHGHNFFRIASDDVRLFSTVADASDFLNGNEPFRDDALEPIRYQIEKCDHVDVVHSIVDLDHGFAGLTASVISDLQDEYCRASTVQFVTFGSRPHVEVAGRSIGAHGRRLHHELNRFMAFTSLAPLSAVFIPMQTSLANDSALGVLGLRLHVNTSAYRLKSSDSWNARDLLVRLTTSSAPLGSALAIPVDGTLGDFCNDPITNDHLLFQGDRDRCAQAVQRLALERGSLHCDKTELATAVKLAPSSFLVRDRHSHVITNLDVIGQWRSSETEFDFVNDLWKKKSDLKTFVQGNHVEVSHVDIDEFDASADYLSRLQSDLVYYRSQHVVRAAPQIRVVQESQQPQPEPQQQ